MFQSYVFSRLLGIHCLATTMDGQLGPLGFSEKDPETFPKGAATISCHSVL
jgi:hypothetical protein